MDRDNFFKLKPISPSCTRIVKDLVPYGKFYPRDFIDKIGDSDHFYIDYLCDAERDNISSGKYSNWKYYFNQYNFRDEWHFDRRKKIGFFGCSFTFGEGIDSKDTFVQIVGNELNYSSFNFGIGGASQERILRTYMAALRVIDFDIVVVTLPTPIRQMYVSDDGEIVNLIPMHNEDAYTKVGKELTRLTDTYYYNKELTNINTFKMLADLKGIKILIGSWDHPTVELVKQTMPSIALDPFPNIDKHEARDNQHPGPISQKTYARQIMEVLRGKTWI